VDALKDILAQLKAANGSSTPNVGLSTDSGSSAAMAIAQAVSAAAKGSEDKFSDKSLISDVMLQKSLLSQSPGLRQRFDESLKSKPDMIPLSQFSAQFWSTRVHLLRSHAVEKSQIQGTYNVLSEVRPKQNSEGTITLALSKEQIQLIFSQHPLVRKVYNDLVPKRLSESDFWSKFFTSRLFKKLKGEMISDQDASIPELDKYLDYDEAADNSRQFEMAHIPRFLDLEGNEQDHSQSQGNAPHFMMKPNSKVPILHILNSMSEKMMANVAPTDGDQPHAPIGMDEAAFNEILLRDLQATESDNRMLLNIPGQQQLFITDKSQEMNRESALDPTSVLAAVNRELFTDPSLLTDFDDAGRIQAADATSSILKSVKQRIALLSDSETGLSSDKIESAIMTHNTTIEFLHYFWNVFQSGDETRAGELSKLVETLDKSLERIDAVSAEAEAERKGKLEQLHQKQQDYHKRTGKRIKIDSSQAGGGKEAVQEMLAATDRAVRFAESEYRRVYREQVVQNAAS
jgi:transcription initiation factor TFIIH subunit 1